MEDEAFFVFVGYYPKGLPVTRDAGGKECVVQTPVIKRATLRKPGREQIAEEGFLFVRTNVDFDPTNKQMGYVLIIHAKTETALSVHQTYFHFPAVVEKEEEAKTLKDRLERGDYKNYLVKGQKLAKVEYKPILVAEN